jgi:hypothetical protein
MFYHCLGEFIDHEIKIKFSNHLKIVNVSSLGFYAYNMMNALIKVCLLTHSMKSVI